MIHPVLAVRTKYSYSCTNQIKGKHVLGCEPHMPCRSHMFASSYLKSLYFPAAVLV